MLALLLSTQISFACEHGKTYKDTNFATMKYAPPNSYDLAVASDGDAYYFPQGSIENTGRGTIWELVHFDEKGMINIFTPYGWCGNQNPAPKEKCPYVVYKGHRWYPQYHGIIYVYKDGREK